MDQSLIGRTFVELPLFSKRWAEIGLGENESLILQIMLLKDPESGPVIEGTGGIRKVRFPLENRGKSHGIRVCYTDIEEVSQILKRGSFQESKRRKT